MRALALGALAGTLWLQARESLPPAWLAALMGVSGLMLLCVLRQEGRWPSFPPWIRAARIVAIVLAAAALGAGWSSWLAQQRLADALPASLEGCDLQLTGVVADLPDAVPAGLRFRFEVERALLDGAPVHVPRQVTLGWYADGSDLPALQPGQRWQLFARLKRPHGLSNPQGFDAEAWWLTEGIRATGSVRPDTARQITVFAASLRDGIGRVRGWLRERIAAALPDKHYASVIIALVIGDQRGVASSDWELFNRTGIGHLVSISGLHITMIAALVAGLAQFLWRHPRICGGVLPLRIPAQQVAAAAGLLAALAYVALAGFGIPAQRTLLMLAVAAAASWSARIVPASQVLACALLAVLLLDPWAVLWPGFWLSFGAIGCILFASAGRVGAQGDVDTAVDLPAPGWRRALASATRMQVAVTIGLVPLTVLMFGQVSLVSPLANALAIPLVSFVVTPLSLVGSVLPAPLCNWLLLCAHAALEGLAAVLGWLAAWPLAVWQVPQPDLPATALALAGTLWMLLPRGWPMRWAGSLAWLPLLTAIPAAPARGLWLTAFDVGQGNAVLVETPNFRLLYDTGPAWSDESDGGSRVILPYLRARGIDRLDALVISHSDSDHAGGARSLLAAIDVGWIASSLPATHPLAGAVAPRHAGCVAGQRWQRDGIAFEFLHPQSEDDAQVRPNARSCALKITAGTQSVLLAGDIEAAQERALLKRDAGRLRADVLLAPHHGSGTSSTPAFLDAVAPSVALFQVGYRNRYRHPKAEVVARYDERGIRVLRSDRSGAVMLRMDGRRMDIEPACAAARYWSSRHCSDAQMSFANDRPD